MPRDPVPYEGSRQSAYDVDIPEDMPVDQESATAEKLVAEPVYDEPIPVRVVEDSKPKQHYIRWSATRMVIPAGKTERITGYKASRKIAIVKNDNTTAGDTVLISPSNETVDYLGYALLPEQDVTVPGPDEIWVHNTHASNDVTVSVLIETVVEID